MAIMEAALRAAWDESDGTVLLSVRQLIDKVQQRHPGLGLRFTNGQWDGQRKTACRRQGLPRCEWSSTGAGWECA